MDCTGITSDITLKQLTITGLSAADRDYDGTTDVAISGTGTVGSDTVSISGSVPSTGTITDKHVGNTIPSMSLTGAESGNDTLTQP